MSQTAKEEIRAFEDSAARGVRHVILVWFVRRVLPLLVIVGGISTYLAFENSGFIPMLFVGTLTLIGLAVLLRGIWRGFVK